MSTVIKPKRSFTTGSIPQTSDLEIGEIAMNIADGKFYTKANANTVKEIGGASAVNIQSVLQEAKNIILNYLLFSFLISSAFLYICFFSI